MVCGDSVTYYNDLDFIVVQEDDEDDYDGDYDGGYGKECYDWELDDWVPCEDLEL